jgi:predicted YcjX-like family ATPase
VCAQLARDWLGFLALDPPNLRTDAQNLTLNHDLYRTFLTACRGRAQLSLLQQPGRFLNPPPAIRSAALPS